MQFEDRNDNSNNNRKKEYTHKQNLITDIKKKMRLPFEIYICIGKQNRLRHRSTGIEFIYSAKYFTRARVSHKNQQYLRYVRSIYRE